MSIMEMPNFLNVGIERIENRIDGVQSKFKNLIRLDD